MSRKKLQERKIIEDFGNTRLGKVRKYLWNLTEYPETSKAAQVRSHNRKMKLFAPTFKLFPGSSVSFVGCHCHIHLLLHFVDVSWASRWRNRVWKITTSRSIASSEQLVVELERRNRSHYPVRDTRNWLLSGQDHVEGHRHDHGCLFLHRVLSQIHVLPEQNQVLHQTHEPHRLLGSLALLHISPDGESPGSPHS